jgi:hypothetical protein
MGQRPIFSILIHSVFVFTLLSCMPSFVSAASLYMDPNSAEMHRGDTITLAVRLDVDEDECVNTVDAVIEYDSRIRAIDVSRGSSILSLWVEDPVINEEDHTITFAGGIPNGYCGRVQGDPRLTNVVAELIFRAPGFSIGGKDDQDGPVEVSFKEETRALLNNGLGTEASLSTYGASITMFDTAGGSIDDNWRERVAADNQSPAEFSIELVQRDGVFSGQYYIVFNTTDKQSGIDHYEVIEEPIEELSLFKWGGTGAPWVEARSPYVLTDQNLTSSIRVKAVDKAGNETVVTLVPDESLQKSQYRNQLILLIGGVLLVLVVVFGLAWFVKRRFMSSVEEVLDDV